LGSRRGRSRLAGFPPDAEAGEPGGVCQRTGQGKKLHWRQGGITPKSDVAQAGHPVTIPDVGRGRKNKTTTATLVIRLVPDG
jgi:hypothetical protein